MPLSVWADFYNWFEFYGLAAIAIHARMLGAFVFLPLFSKNLPNQVRTALPLACLPLVYFAMQKVGTLPTSASSNLLFSVVFEFFFGFLITLPAGLVFWVAHAAGELIDIQTGASNNAVFNPSTESPEGPASVLMSQLAILVFVVGGGFQSILRAILTSYRVVPPNDYSGLNFSALPSIVDQIFSQFVVGIFHLFTPIMVLFLMVELCIGLAAKLAQQLHIETITAPLKSLFFPICLIVLLQQPDFIGLPAAMSFDGMIAALKVLTKFWRF